jgi:hypothetical protein
MVGRYIRINYIDTVNTGDGLWYEISAVSSTTSLTLTRKYGGNTITAGSANYTIGQMPLLPEAYHDLPWIFAAGMYWDKEADARGQKLLQHHGNFGEAGIKPTGRVADLVRNWSTATTSMILDDGYNQGIINPNLTITI